MRKKTIIIKHGENPIYVADTRDLDIMEFLSLKKEAETNLASLVADYHNLQDRVATLEESYAEILHEIKILKGE